MNRYKAFLKAVKETYSEHSYIRIKHALRIAISENANLTRYNGEPFVYHSIGVAEIVMGEIGLGSNSVISSLLQDVSRRGEIDNGTVEKEFGIECVEILEGLNKISAVETKASKEQAEHFKELIISYSVNPRVILIKLADRLEVMRSLGSFPDEKRAKKSWESLHIYAQLAHKLGLYGIKSELEDLSLSYLYPLEYNDIKEKLEQTASERTHFIEHFVKPISDRLKSESIKFVIKGRTKSIYSIWKKMKKQHISFSEIYDVFAVRIILDCPREEEKSACWHVYSVVTDFYKPNPERLRDWISIPKSNGYESLHTTVVTPEGKWVEVQIRSERMDEVAERGIAAHWRYKGVSDDAGDQWLTRLRGLMEGMDTGHETIAGSAPELGVNNHEIFVFTPNGDLRKLPEGATVLDFAFDIHSNLGSTCVGAKVNHRNVSIRETLKNGDIVEINTLKSQKPKADWLNFVKTGKARSKIKSFLREEEAKMANLGREELERKVRNWKLNIGLEDALNALLKYYKFKSGLELYGFLAQEKIAMSDVKEVLTRYINGEDLIHMPEKRGEKKKQKESSAEDRLIIDEQLKNVDYRLAKCCNPVYGDEIFGFVSVKGLTIHRIDCVNGAKLQERYPYRIIPAAWNEHTTGSSFSAKIGFVSEDVIGLEHSVRDILKELDVTPRGINQDYADNKIKGIITLEVSSTGMLDSVIYRLMKIKGMLKTYRIGAKNS